MNLKEMREQAGLTQEQLAALTELDQTTISQLETGKVQDPRFSTITALARAYKRTPEEIAAAIVEAVAS